METSITRNIIRFKFLVGFEAFHYIPLHYTTLHCIAECQTSLATKNTVVFDVAPCVLVDRYQYFGEA